MQSLYCYYSRHALALLAILRRTCRDCCELDSSGPKSMSSCCRAHPRVGSGLPTSCLSDSMIVQIYCCVRSRTGLLARFRLIELR
mmetsp:Transcript_39785/g.91430  ORF Transcript_39785/g.91430 Transcript_39785/m.91430 type:complete len:85 (-) Transcript_39785:294-548(-)